MMPQAAVQEAVQQNEKELLRTAAYARLSVENGGHETEDSLHFLKKFRPYLDIRGTCGCKFIVLCCTLQRIRKRRCSAYSC